jgi:hypothetical protein
MKNSIFDRLVINFVKNILGIIRSSLFFNISRAIILIIDLFFENILDLVHILDIKFKNLLIKFFIFIFESLNFIF